MIYTFKDVTLDDSQRQVLRGGKPLHMRAKCFDALLAMVEHAGATIGKDVFHDLLWPGEAVSEASLTQLIYELRTQLGDENGDLIATIPKSGYRLSSEVRAIPRPQTEQYLEGFDTYELCAKGRVLLERRGKDAFLKARDLFQAAIEKNVAYAPAHLGLAQTWGLLGSYNYIIPKIAFPAAQSEATIALELDPMLAQAYAVLAHTALFFDWNWQRAQELANKAISMNSVQEMPYHTLGWLHLIFGQYEAARKSVARGLDAYPTSLNLHSTLGIIYLFEGETERAIGLLRSMLEVNPSYIARYYLGNALVTQPETVREAVTELELVTADESSVQTCASLAYALALAGSEQDARGILESLEIRARREYISHYSLGLIHTGLGDFERAFRELEIGVQERAGWSIFLATEPRFKALRPHRQFSELTARIGLTADRAP